MATRSRLGCGFKLGSPGADPVLVLRLEEQTDGVRVYLEQGCLQMTPVEAAQDVYGRLVQQWELHGDVSHEERRARAWQWWKQEVPSRSLRA